MLKSHIKLFIFTSVCILISIYSFRYLGQELIYDNERVIWKTKAEMIKNISKYDYDYLVFGDSRTLAINPIFLEKKYNIKVINLSTGGSTLPAIYFFIKRAINNEKNKLKLKKIYIAISPQNISKSETAISRSFGERYIRFVSKEEEIEELSKNYPEAKEKYERIFTFPYRNYFYKREHTIALGLLKLLKNGVSNSGLRKVTLETKGFAVSNPYTYQYEQVNDIVSKDKLDRYIKKRNIKNNNIHNISYVYMEKIKDLLRDNLIEYEFFMAPLPDLRKNEKKLAFGKTIEVYNLLNKKNINNNILLLNRKYFKDPSHVNYKGSILFNKYFYECIINKKCENTYKLKELKNKDE